MLGGSASARLLSSPSLKEALGVPAQHPYHYPMMLGYPKAKILSAPGTQAPKDHVCIRIQQNTTLMGQTIEFLEKKKGDFSS